MHFSLFALAEELLFVPLRSTSRLASDFNVNGVKMGFIGMTARCGSTLITQMMNKYEVYSIRE